MLEDDEVGGGKRNALERAYANDVSIALSRHALPPDRFAVHTYSSYNLEAALRKKVCDLLSKIFGLSVAHYGFDDYDTFYIELSDQLPSVGFRKSSLWTVKVNGIGSDAAALKKARGHR